MKIYYAIIFFLLGSSLASFYGVVGKRLLKGESIVKPRSHCDSCNHQLSSKELIPIFSFLLLKGKCKYCHQKLDISEPLLELFTGISFAILYWYYGVSYNLWISLILISLLDLIFITDFTEMLILDSPLIISSILIFFLKLYYYDLTYAFKGVLAGLILFLFMLLVGFIGKILFKREALGGGDIKLSFVMGLTLSLPLGFVSLILSTFLALPYATFSLFSTKEREVPFGPFLISSLLIVFLFSEKFMNILYLFYL